MPWEWLVPVALGIIVAAQQLKRSAYAEHPSALDISISTAFIAVLLPVFVLDVAGRLRRRRRLRLDGLTRGAGPPGAPEDPRPPS